MAISAVLVRGGQPLAVELSEAVEAIGKAELVWIDADGRTPELDALLARLQVHPLTIEDVFEKRNAPKIEDFGRYLYILAHAVHVPPEGASKLRKAELDMVLGDRWIFTHHDPELTAAAKVREEILRRAKGTDCAHIAHMLLDHVVDDSVLTIDAVDDAISKLERVSLEPRPRRSTVGKVMALRASLHRFRRTAIHQREVLLRLSRGEFSQIPQEMLPFFRDVHDHSVRIADLIDDARELLNGVLEAHLSMVSIRLNEVMKVLTMIATVFLPLSFIAGLYGMNFKYMPELSWKYGYPMALLMMLLTAGGLLAWFRRRGWFD